MADGSLFQYSVYIFYIMQSVSEKKEKVFGLLLIRHDAPCIEREKRSSPPRMGA